MDLICSHLIFKVSHRINSEPLEASFGLQTSGRQSRQTEPTGTKPAVKSRIWGTLHGLFCLYNKGSIHCILFYSFVFDYLHSSTHLHTHTCSETSYRITEVECISCAKNNPLKLTGKFRRFEVRNLSEVFLRLSSDAAQNSDCENRTGTEKLNALVLSDSKKEIDVEVLGFSLFPFLITIGRYVRKASLSDITDQSKRLC